MTSRGNQLVRMTATALALLCAAAAGARSARAGGARCEFELRQGEVTFASPLPAENPLSERVQGCLAALADELRRRPGIRAVTVAARLPAEQRVGGAGLAIARSAAELLVQGGVDAWRVSAVAPASQPGEPALLHIAYRERHASRPVARLLAASGLVETGAAVAELERAGHGTLLYPRDFVRTGASSFARLLLADGSYLRLGSDSLLRLGRIELNEKLERNVQLVLLGGSLETIVRPGGLSMVFNVLTRTAVAGVRGTDFRTHASAGDTRIETLGGEVLLAGTLDAVSVGAGRGSRVGSDGFPERTRKLLAAPVVVEPRKGRVFPADRLRWGANPSAAHYIVEIARDAEFSRYVHARSVRAPAVEVGSDLDPGKWFWRVAAVDADGFVGRTSKVYSFGLDRGR